MSEHNRRSGYWLYYELATKEEKAHMIRMLIRLVQEHPCPRPKKGKRGRPPVHSREKLDFLLLLMMADDDTYRGIVADLQSMRTPWDDEPVPVHTTLVRHAQTVPEEWLEHILAETARLCLKEVGDATGPLAADSSGMETTRYGMVERPNKKKRDFVMTRQKIYWKYHIAAILGLQIILAAVGTPGSVNDSIKLPTMLRKIRRHGFDVSGRFFNADRGYDSDDNCKELFWMGMIPNIKQRKDAKNRDKPNRRKAAEMFDGVVYHLRGMMHGAFWAEETRRHQLQRGFVRDDNRRRFAQGRAIAWNIRVLNRFECANRLNIPIPSYGVTHWECA